MKTMNYLIIVIASFVLLSCQSNKTNPKINLAEMVLVSDGAFTPDDSTYNVTLSSYYIAKYETTQSEWVKVMKGNKNDILVTVPLSKKLSIIPIDQVSYYDVLVFCNRKSIQEGLTPCYAIEGETNPDNWGISPSAEDALPLSNIEITQKWDTISLNLNAEGYRLPTEMEWEFAARGGNTAQKNGNFNTVYSGSDSIDQVACYDKNDYPQNADPVGTKTPNELGIFDMSGNVNEWCQDTYASYPSGSFNDPYNVEKSLSHVVRGGGRMSVAKECSVTFRSSCFSNQRNKFIGLRLVRKTI